MYKLILIFITTLIVASITAKPLNVSDEDYYETMMLLEKVHLLCMVEDLTDLTEVKKLLKTEEGKNYTIAWLKEMTDATCEVFNIVKNKSKTYHDFIKTTSELERESFDIMAMNYYDNRRSSPWPKVLFDPEIRDAFFDPREDFMVNSNQTDVVTDRDITDPIITKYNINKLFKWPIVQYATGISNQKVDEAKKILLGNRISQVEYDAMWMKVRDVYSYLTESRKINPDLKGIIYKIHRF